VKKYKGIWIGVETYELLKKEKPPRMTWDEFLLVLLGRRIEKYRREE